MVRLESDQFEALDAWSAKQKPAPSRPEAIRRLVEIGLTVKTPTRPVSAPVRALRARELAVETIKQERATPPLRQRSVPSAASA